VNLLPRGLRREAEFLFGADFGGVRVCESDLPVALETIACTRGSDIHLAPGAVDPGSARGRDVLGHELAHVLQQRGGCSGAGWELEGEAAVAGRRFALGQPVRLRRPGRPARAGGTPGRAGTAGGREPVTQCYTVVAAGAPFGAHAVAVAHGQHNAPVHPDDTFIGQVKVGSSFLAGGAVNLVAANPAATALRISANGLIAIEHADLSGRQPKSFYATAGIVNESNARLALMNSYFRLVPDAAGVPGVVQQQITVGPNVLTRVTPQNVNNHTTGLVMDAEQPCNQLVERVLGANDPVPFYAQPLHPVPHLLIEYHVARELLPPPLPAVLDITTAVTLGTTMAGIAVPYATAAWLAGGPFVAAITQYGLNQFAAPGVGEAFVTSSLVAPIAGAGVALGNMPAAYYDYYHAIGPPVAPSVILDSRTWGSHYAGVVARDGTDVVTLENYARGTEDAMLGNDTRYFFQMYQTDPAGAGSTWHQQWTTTPMQPIAVPPPGMVPIPDREPVSPGAKGFANPITLRLVVPDARWDAIAAAQYGGVNINTIKNDHNLIAGAALASAEIAQVLKGLQYANYHINRNEAGAAARVLAWSNALTAAYAAAQFRENLPVIQYTHSRVLMMHTH
jgi:hypothetical protein